MVDRLGRSAQGLQLVALDVHEHDIRLAVTRTEIVDRKGRDAPSRHSRAPVLNPPVQSELKETRGPRNRRFYDLELAGPVARRVRPSDLEVVGIGLDRNHEARFPHRLRQHQRNHAVVGSEVEYPRSRRQRPPLQQRDLRQLGHVTVVALAIAGSDLDLQGMAAVVVADDSVAGRPSLIPDAEIVQTPGDAGREQRFDHGSRGSLHV